MKILFFRTNLSYNKSQAYVGLGWIDSFITHLKREEVFTSASSAIGIVFFSDQVNKLTVEEFNGVTQFIVPAYKNKFDKIKRKLQLTDYLFDENLGTILSIVENFKPDLLHVFGTENAFGSLASLVKVPVVVHIQGLLNPYLRKYLPAGYDVNSLLRSTSFKRLLLFSGPIGNYFTFKKLAKREERICKGIRYFTGRTDWDRRVIKVMNANAGYFHCDEILRNSFYNKQWTSTGFADTTEIISVINPDVYKGLETVFEVMHLLNRESTRQFRWTVAGISENHPLVKMYLRKSGLKLSSLNIKFAGPLQEEQLVDALLSANLFVHPSHIDNSPNSLCEAMMLGMPVISTAVGGVQSLLTDGVEGLLVQDGEPYGMAGAILEISASNKKARELGQNARKRALQRHNPGVIIERTLAIYQQILSTHIKKESKSDE